MLTNTDEQYFFFFIEDLIFLESRYYRLHGKGWQVCVSLSSRRVSEFPEVFYSQKGIEQRGEVRLFLYVVYLQ